MPGLTVGGLPYPLESEMAQDGAAILQQIAECLDQPPVEMEVAMSKPFSHPMSGWHKNTNFDLTLHEHAPGAALTRVPEGVQVAVAGRYQIDAAIIFEGGGGPARYAIGIAKSTDPSPVTPNQDVRFNTTADEIHHMISVTMSFDAGDVVSLWGYLARPGAQATQRARDTWMAVRRLRGGQPHS